MDFSNIDMQSVISNLVAQVSAWGIKVIGAVIIFWIGRAVARWVRRFIRRMMEKGEVDATLVPFVSGLAYYALMVAVIIAALTAVGVNTTSAIAVLGAAGLAVGLALQGTLSNFAAGVMLLVFRPFPVSDFIDAGGNAGSVQAIGLFATTMNTPDNVQIVIPNSKIFGDTIKNFAANDTRRVDLVVGISYDDDIQVAVRTLNEVMDSDNRILSEPAPVVEVHELGDSAVNLVVRPWCKREDYWALRWHLTRTFKERIEAAGCSFPYPQRDVHVHQEVGAA